MKPPQQAASPLSLLWQPKSILLTMLLAEVLAIVLALTPGLVVDARIYLGLMSLLLQWVALSTLALAWLLKRWLARLPAPHLLWVLLALLALSALLLSALAAALLPPALAMTRPGGMGALAWLQIPALIVILGVLGGIAFHRHWESKQLALRAKQAELDLLRARVDPHFLFNTLNTATALVHTRPEQAEAVLLDLSDLFRAALSGRELQPLAHEIALTRRYLQIEALRLGSRLTVTWRLPEPLPEAELPTLALQTLAENAVRHGIERLPAGGEVHIATTVAGDTLRVAVHNPVNPDAAPGNGHRIGLDATRSRMAAMGTAQARLETRQVGNTFHATLHLPLHPPSP